MRARMAAVEQRRLHQTEQGRMEEGIQALSLLVATIAASAAYLLSRIASEPHVIVYTKHDRDRPTMLILVIENIGRGVAYDIQFELERRIPKAAWGVVPKGRKQAVDTMCEGPLIAGVPSLPPGERRIINWGQYGGLRDALGGRPVRVRARFEGGWPIRWSHEVESVLEVASFEGTDASKTPEQAQVRELARIAQSAEAVARAVRSWEIRQESSRRREDG